MSNKPFYIVFGIIVLFGIYEAWKGNISFNRNFYIAVGIIIIYIIYKAWNNITNFLGFGPGTISIQLEKSAFSPGEFVTGTIALNLRKPIDAKGVILSIVGESGPSKRRSRFSAFSQKISDAKIFSANPETVPFRVQIPPEFLKRPDTKKVNSLFYAIGSAFAGNIDWYLETKLDVLKKLDVSCTIPITISNNQQLR